MNKKLKHLVNTTDNICGSLLVHYMCDNTNMIELACLLSVAPHNVYFIDITIVCKY